MAKQHSPSKPDLPSVSSLPSVVELPSASPSDGEVVTAVDTPVPVKQMLDGRLCTCMVEVPMLQFDGVGFVKRRIEAKLSTDQAMALKGLKLGLEAADARLKDGSRVRHASDAIRWMLENLA